MKPNDSDVVSGVQMASDEEMLVSELPLASSLRATSTPLITNDLDVTPTASLKFHQNETKMETETNIMTNVGENKTELSSNESKKMNPTSENGLVMSSQIVQLQDMVTEMKLGFSSALEALAQIQYGDQVLQERVDNNKQEYEHQLADVVQMVLSLKTEFGSVMKQLQVANDNQNRLQKKVECLQYERDIMLEELERQGNISAQIREKYHSGLSRPNGLNRTSDSTTLNLLLERAHTAFGTPRSHNVLGTPRIPPMYGTPRNHNHNVSDHDSGVTGVNTYREQTDTCSCDEGSPPVVNPMVQSFIAGLQDSVHHHSQSMPVGDDLPVTNGYESDSSLTMAANKSLDMSRSLGDKCAEVVMAESSDEEEEIPKEEVHEDIQNGNDPQTKGSGEERIQPVDHSPIFAQPHTPRRPGPHELNTKEVQRARVAREIMETETKYCSNLWTILDLYVGPLQSTGILSMKDTCVMFPSCMTTIYDYHCAFLQSLEERMTNWKWQSIVGDILCRFIESSECDLLLQYQMYVNDFPASLYQIRKSCKQSARFRKFLRMMQRHPSCEGLDIGSFMVTPIQRIPRYVLLLKQLLKFTPREHPDYYYVECALERVGDFLNRLNDSIEYSMQIVSNGGGDASPKSRRKLRIGSFRSSSVGSYDASSSRNNDNSFQAPDDHSMMSTSTSAGSRFFSFSFLRESFRRKNNQASNSQNQNHSTPAQTQSSTALPSRPVITKRPPIHTNSFNFHSTRDRDPDNSFSARAKNNSYCAPEKQQHSFVEPGFVNPRDNTFSGYERDQSFNDVVNRSMPLRQEKKKRPKHRRPKSSFSQTSQPEHGDVQMRMNNSQQESISSSKKRHCKQRPRSLIDQMSDASRRSSGRTSQSQWPATTSQESINTITAEMPPASALSLARQRILQRQSTGSSETLENPASDSKLAKSLPDVSNKINEVVARNNSRRLPKPPTKVAPMKNDFGIYGDNDDLSDGDDDYHSAVVGRMHPLLEVQRSASHGDVVRDASHSPSQHYINMALARSLTENHLDGHQNPSSVVLPRTSTSLLETGSYKGHTPNQSLHLPNKNRPRSAIPRHVTLPRENTPPDTLPQRRPPSIGQSPQPLQKAWSESPATPQNDFLNIASVDSASPKKDIPWRKKKSGKKAKEYFTEPGEGEKEKRKMSLKNSIKNIFMRKRKFDSSNSTVKSPPAKNVNILDRFKKGSRSLDIVPFDEFPDNGHQVYTSMATPYIAPIETPVSSRPSSPRQQAPPPESVVILEPIGPELETYEDENGDPCSAV